MQGWPARVDRGASRPEGLVRVSRAPTEAPVKPTWRHQVHHVVGGPIAFSALLGACLTLAGQLQGAWRWYTVLTAVVGLAMTMWTAIAYQRDAAHTGLVQWWPYSRLLELDRGPRHPPDGKSFPNLIRASGADSSVVGATLPSPIRQSVVAALGKAVTDTASPRCEERCVQSPGDLDGPPRTRICRTRARVAWGTWRWSPRWCRWVPRCPSSCLPA
jgi:hypothetical protein